MFKKISFVILVVLLIGMFSTGAFSATKLLNVYGAWAGAELEAFDKMVKPFEDANDIDVVLAGSRDPAVLITRVEAGNPPDVSTLPNPGAMVEFAKAGKLVDLSTFMDVDTLKSDYSSTWIDLGSYKGKLQGVFLSADLKSLVWYNPKAFAAAGYTTPAT